jgi:hypothetical protein
MGKYIKVILKMVLKKEEVYIFIIMASIIPAISKIIKKMDSVFISKKKAIDI